MSSFEIPRPRERARAESRRREAVLRATLDAVASGTWEFDAHTGELRNDERWLAIFGLDPSEHDGRIESFVRRIHPEDRDRVMEEVQRCLRGEVPGYLSEHRMIRADDGRTIWVRDAGRVTHRDAAGRAREMVGAVVDITALMEQQAELERARRAAEAASYAKSRFLANTSHELRTPMNGVLGMLDQLLETALDEEQKHMAEAARASARGLLALLNDLLDSSKLEAGKLTLEAVSFDLRGSVGEVVDLFTPQLAAQPLELRSVVVDECPVHVTGDPTRLRQILVNLVGNAVKFTKAGWVEVRVEPAGADRVGFSVRDTGVGIAPDALTSLFDRFTQADVSTTRRFGGTGLGLSITRQLVELMGGDLRVESEVGVGSRFSFELPLAGAREPASPSDSEPSPEPVELEGPLRVLVAEDVPVNQWVTRRLLERLGHTVVVVEDGAAAVEAVANHPFDVVLMDVHMPRMDGVEATRAIRTMTSVAAGIPIVALTANAMVGDRERYLEAGMDDYVTKPVEKARLLAAIGRAVRSA